MRLNLNDGQLLLHPPRRVSINARAAEEAAAREWNREQNRLAQLQDAADDLADPDDDGAEKKRGADGHDIVLPPPDMDDGADAIKTAIAAPESTNLAERLVGVPEWRSMQEWLLWHRPRTGLTPFLNPHKPRVQLNKKLWVHEGGTRILPRNDHARKSNPGNTIDPVDISPLEQPVFLLEHVIEEVPTYVLNYGMRLRLLNMINYKYPFAMNFDLSRKENAKFKYMDCDIRPSWRTFDFGKTIEVPDEVKGSLIGARHIPSYCRMVKSKLFRAPFVAHKPRTTDFVLVASTRTVARGSRVGTATSSSFGAKPSAANPGVVDTAQGSNKPIRPKMRNYEQHTWHLYIKQIAFLAAVGQQEPLMMVYPPVNNKTMFVEKSTQVRSVRTHDEYKGQFCRPYFSWALRRLMVKLKPLQLDRALVTGIDDIYRVEIGYYPQLAIGKWHRAITSKDNLVMNGFDKNRAKYILKPARERRQAKYEIPKPENVCRFESLMAGLNRLNQFGILLHDLWKKKDVVLKKLDTLNDLEFKQEIDWQALLPSVQARLKRECFVMRRIKQLLDQCSWQTSMSYLLAVGNNREDYLELRGCGDPSGSIPVSVGTKNVSSSGDGYSFQRYARARERKLNIRQMKKFLSLRQGTTDDDLSSAASTTVTTKRRRPHAVSKQLIIRMYNEQIPEEERFPEFDAQAEWTDAQRWKYIRQIQRAVRERMGPDNQPEDLVESKKRRQTILSDAVKILESQVRALQLYDDGSGGLQDEDDEDEIMMKKRREERKQSENSSRVVMRDPKVCAEEILPLSPCPHDSPLRPFTRLSVFLGVCSFRSLTINTISVNLFLTKT